MDPTVFLHPTPGGAALAGVAVVLGAPWFSDGLRAFRLREQFAKLHRATLADLPSGFVQVRGQVALESPMFTPLSGKPAAAFRLEIHARHGRLTQFVDERRAFRLMDGGATARVQEHRALLDLPVTATRDLAFGEAPGAQLGALLDRAPEMRWAHRTGLALTLVERALFVGAECHVVGYARHGRPLTIVEDVELARTGTDDATLAATSRVRTFAAGSGPAPRADAMDAGDPDLWLGSGEHLDFLLVSGGEPALSRYTVPAWRVLGTALGPALSMAGLLYLASALDFWRAHGAF
jgi:hypothetical protein